MPSATSEDSFVVAASVIRSFHSGSSGMNRLYFRPLALKLPQVTIEPAHHGLDLVVACDTALAHLAGALARPVWMPQSVASDWRWIRGRDDCVWYPTMRFFRQRSFGDWSEVFERMADELGKLRPTS